MEQPDIQESAITAPEITDAEVVTETPELETEGLLTEGNLETTQDDDLDEIEHEGEKFKVPKKLKDAFLRQADYTRKTQEVAEQRRLVENQAQEVQKRNQDNQQYLREVGTIVSIDEQLASYKDVNWQALIDQDPVNALKHQNYVQQLQQKRAELVNTVAQKQQQAALNEQQAHAKLVQEAAAYFAREIPGWSATRSDQLMEYGVAQGLQADAITRFVTRQPAFAKILNKAEMYDQLVRKQQKKPEPVDAKVVTKVGASSGAVQKDPTKMTDHEFAQWRKRQIAQRR